MIGNTLGLPPGVLSDFVMTTITLGVVLYFVRQNRQIQDKHDQALSRVQTDCARERVETSSAFVKTIAVITERTDVTLTGLRDTLADVDKTLTRVLDKLDE